MKAVSLLYHDIVPSKGHMDTTGFTNPGANVYKVEVAKFDEQLRNMKIDTTNVCTIRTNKVSGKTPIYLTFDDGGKSAVLDTRDILNKYGMKGHFFITTSLIGTENFLSKKDIIMLDEEGHVVGSHSHSHPKRISSLPPNNIEEEWKKSIEILNSILNKKITTASIPGGFYSDEVVKFAAKHGITHLFTSEPKRKLSSLYGCELIGRYMVLGNTSTHSIKKIYQENILFLIKQFLTWEIKKTAKKILGRHYIALRRRILKYFFH